MTPEELRKATGLKDSEVRSIGLIEKIKEDMVRVGEIVFFGLTFVFKKRLANLQLLKLTVLSFHPSFQRKLLASIWRSEMRGTLRIIRGFLLQLKCSSQSTIRQQEKSCNKSWRMFTRTLTIHSRYQK